MLHVFVWYLVLFDVGMLVVRAFDIAFLFYFISQSYYFVFTYSEFLLCLIGILLLSYLQLLILCRLEVYYRHGKS